MRIGLIDVDSHNFPNLALMKISAYHKAKGDHVEWWNGFMHYDVVYKSRVFDDTYSNDHITAINADQVISGGTGYSIEGNLPDEIEHQYPDYALYPKYKEAYGFLTRGCPRSCGFCIVSNKEGWKSRKVADLSEFFDGQREIKLLDPNILAAKEHEELLQQLAQSGAWVDFTQGLDVRLVDKDNIGLLNAVKTKAMHFAWDNPKDDLADHFARYLKHSKVKDHRKLGVYVLTNYDSTHEEDLHRVNTLRAIGFDPYIMIYDKPTAPVITRRLQRWVNNKIIFHSTESFDQYDYRIDNSKRLRREMAVP